MGTSRNVIVALASAAVVVGTASAGAAAPKAGVTMSGIGPWQVGQVVSAKGHRALNQCYAYDLARTSGVSLVGASVGHGRARIDALYVTKRVYGTAAGIRAGDSYARLQKAYGKQLQFAKKGHSTKSGLEGTYQDVAGVRSGQRYIVFYLEHGKIGTIKVSRTTGHSWGDDEGCV